jgi:hypothetical protein
MLWRRCSNYSRPASRRSFAGGISNTKLPSGAHWYSGWRSGCLLPSTKRGRGSPAIAALPSRSISRSMPAEFGFQLLQNRARLLSASFERDLGRGERLRLIVVKVGRLDSGGSVRLTRREREVLRLIGEGTTTKEVAQHLGISPKDRAGASRESEAEARLALDRCDGPLRDQAQVYPPRLTAQISEHRSETTVQDSWTTPPSMC